MAAVALELILNTSGSFTFILTPGIERTMNGAYIVMETFDDYDSLIFHHTEGRWSTPTVQIEDLTVAGGTDKATKVDVLKNVFKIGTSGGSGGGGGGDASATNQVEGNDRLGALTSPSATDSTSSWSLNSLMRGFLNRIGAVNDARATDSTSSWTVNALLKGLYNLLSGVLAIRGTRSNAGTDAELGASHLTIGGSDGVNLKRILTDPTGKIKTFQDAGDKDIFGALVTTSRQPQVNIQFNTAFLNTLVNIIASGGASGAVNPINGFATFSSGTGTTASISATSQNSVVYQSGSEIFAEFTADFTTPTSASSFQRIGLYNALNGFFIGYNGTTFGIGSRLNGVDTIVPQVSFSVDTLLGVAGSLFSRNNVAEAINFTRFNIYRIRFGWLGIASVFFEALSPDGVWVTFHRILFPNTLLTASVANPNLPVSLEISKTAADATNLQIGTACWAAGITGTIVPQSLTPPLRNSQAVVVTPAQQQIFRTTFSKTIPAGVDSEFWNLIQVGAGQTIAQSGGALVLNAQTTINSETIIRSNRTFMGSFVLRAQTLLSQRNANNNFFIELVDIIGDGLAVTVNSATSITVTFPPTFLVDSTFVGQSMYIGAFQGFTGVTALGGRYAIASVSGQAVTFTVASFATGADNTGTCSVFGWNYHQIVYTGASATAVNYDSQRRGWNSGATVATINTTASPGHMAIMGSEDSNAYLADQLVASGTILPILPRASRVVNIADESAPLFLQIRSLNGNTAPTNTIWTVGMIGLENFSTQAVNITNSKVQGANTAQNVSLLSPIPTGGNTIGNIGTLAGGQTAHSSPSTGALVRIGGRVAVAADTTLVAGDASDLLISSAQQAIVKLDSITELDFNRTAIWTVGSGTARVAKNAPPAGTRNYIKQLTLSAFDLLADLTVRIQDDGMSVTTVSASVMTTSVAHNLNIGDEVIFLLVGGITGIVDGGRYYVLTVPSTTTFTISILPNAGLAIGVGGTGGGSFLNKIHFRFKAPLGDSNLTFNFPSGIRGALNRPIEIGTNSIEIVTGEITFNVSGYTGL